MSDLADTAPPPQYMLDSITDRDRLYLMFDLLHESFESNLARALELAGLPSDPATASWRMLDGCCGEGLHAIELAQRYAKAQIVAFDRDDEAMITAASAFSHVPNATFVRHDALEPLPPEIVQGGFDLAQIRFGLTHFGDGARGLRNIHDALKPGGVLYLVDPRSDVFDFSHPSMIHFSSLVVQSWARFGTKAAGDRQVELCRQAGLEVLASERESHDCEGGTADGRAMVKLMIETVRSMRKALVDTTQLISGADFDEHIRRLRVETGPEHKGRCNFQVTWARRPK